ncbi:MAG: DMT family transporter [Desulfurococcales archaeon]|nr:DMT family transporter [Desulfurococcales archaeon]
MNRASGRDLLLLLLAVANVSTASMWVKLAGGEGVHGFEAATWRLAISSIITFLVLVGRGKAGFADLKGLGRRGAALMLLSGVSLSLHFDLWMLSLFYTSVAVSVTVVDSYPVVLALVGRFLFGESYTFLHYLGSSLAFGGIVLMSFYTSRDVALDLYGILLALGGMLGVALYFSIGKYFRSRGLPTDAYTATVYSVAALTSAVLTLLIGEDLRGFTMKGWAYLVALALIPMLGGHTVLNYLLGRLSLLATTVPVLGEPVGATILAYLVLGESVEPAIVVFMAVTLTGIGLVMVADSLRHK